ncbi:MAG: hypothetical protein V4717_22645 [Bacteroidota bacterium]
MRKIVLALFLFPFIGFAQTRNVLSVQRVFPKVDKVAEFEKALANHAQKFHSGTWKWRVYQVESGPDFGGFMIIEGPNTWDEFDHRGDLGADHMGDWNKSIAPFIIQQGSSDYLAFNEQLSNVALTDYSKWISINHIFYNPGYASATEDIVVLLKKIWINEKEAVAVYNANSSGEPQYAIVTRYKQGLKEKDAGTMLLRGNMKDRFIKANGADGYTDFLEQYRKAISKQWSELLSFREDLSSK